MRNYQLRLNKIEFSHSQRILCCLRDVSFEGVEQTAILLLYIDHKICTIYLYLAHRPVSGILRCKVRCVLSSERNASWIEITTLNSYI